MFLLLFLFFRYIYPRVVELLSHMVVLFFSFFEILAYCFPQWLHQFRVLLNRGFPFSPLPHHHLLFVFFLMITILTCLSWYLIVICICTSLVMSDVEDLFMSLLIICISFLGKISVQVFCPVFNQFFFFWCWVVWVIYICWIWPQVGHIICKYFLPFNKLSFHVGDGFLCCT